MKIFALVLLLIVWLILTLVLSVSVVGWVILLPVQNNSFDYMPMSDDRRSTWMLIGIRILRKLLE